MKPTERDRDGSYAAAPRVAAGVLFLACAYTVMLFASHNQDPALYLHYARDFWTGPDRFRSLPAEYPAAALLPFSLMLAIPLPTNLAWTAIMAPVVAVTVIALLRFGPRPAAGLYLIYAALGTGATVLLRYDAIPALLCLLASFAHERGRNRSKYALLAAATALKAYPVVLVPILVLDDIARRPVIRRRCLRDAALGFVLPLAVLALSLTAWTGLAWLSPLTYESRRPIQVESAPASALWIASLLGNFTLHRFESFSSWNVSGGPGQVIVSVAAILLLLGYALILYRLAKGSLSVRRAALAAVCLVIITSKVFSPQYLVWVLPLVALEERLSFRWVAVCVLTSVIFPFLYVHEYMSHSDTASTYSWIFMAVIAARNGVFAAMTLLIALSGLSSPLPATHMPPEPEPAPAR